MALFAKYDGMDGESKDADHERWIDILSLDWGAHKAGEDKKGRRRKRPMVEDLLLTMEYEKAAPKLLEKCLKHMVIPKLEIEQTATHGGYLLDAQRPTPGHTPRTAQTGHLRLNPQHGDSHL